MKTLPLRLTICAKRELDLFARSGITHILAVEDPLRPREVPAWFTGPHRQWRFHDVETQTDASLMGAVLATRVQIEEILAFGRECLDSRAESAPHLLVHCHAGASRSPAVAYAILAQHLGAGRAEEALGHVMRVRPCAYPNRLVVRLADEILGRDGELLRALAPLRQEFGALVDEWAAKLRGSPPPAEG